MEKLKIVTWFWGSKYPLDWVVRLAAGVRRNLHQPYEFILVCDKKLSGSLKFVDRVIEQPSELYERKGCFARLIMYSPEWQQRHGIEGRLVCMDIDSVITGPLDPLFDRPESFVILQGGNAANPCPYNGALQMVRSGTHSEVWSNFTWEAGQKTPFHEFPDDQGWLSVQVPNAAGWKCGKESGVYVFQKPGWPGYPRFGNGLPSGARLVTFNGWRSPSKFKHLHWISRNWTMTG